jgi:integrase
VSHKAPELLWDEWRETLAQEDTSTTTKDAESLVKRELGGVADPASVRRLAYALLKARVRVLEAFDARDRGDLVDTPQAPAKRGPSLLEVLERWAREARPTPRTVSEFKRIIETFTRATGNHPIERIRREHVVAFKDALVSAGRAPKTVWKACTAVGTLLRYAKRNGLIRENVAEGVVGKSKAAPAERRLPFTQEDIGTLWRSPVYTETARPAAGGGQAAYWLPVLGLFTGARLEELGQLHVDDVRQEDKVHYLDINADAEGKALKTESSRRRVPLHRELVRLGFLTYVEARRKAGDMLLFPELRADRYGKRTGNWSKWFGRYLRNEVGIKDARKVFHSFKHTFKSACRRAGVEEELHDALTGHVSGAVGRAYGDYPLGPLKAAVDRVGLKGPA